MQKRKGFGRKREMLCGVMERHYRSPAPRRGLTARAAANGSGDYRRWYCQRVVVAGAITGGWQVTLYCADEAPALGASGIARGRCIRY